jgi:hypothetical protein
MLTWTTEKPTVPGGYWLRNAVASNLMYRSDAPILVTVSMHGGGLRVAVPADEVTLRLEDMDEGEWAGPLTPPE